MARRADAFGTPWGGRSWDPSLRVGDAERNEVAEALSQHFSAGRLDHAELKERLDGAMSAKTGGDLAGLLDDLPPLPGQQPAAVPVRHRRRGGALLLGIALLALMAAPWRVGAVAWHAGPWMPWMWFPPFPVLVFGAVAFMLWRRSRRRRWHSEMR